MRLALREAMKGQGLTTPNPIVGAIIVKNNQVIARGYHASAGEAHAEVAAMSFLSQLASHDEAEGASDPKKPANLSSSANTRGTTLYVTLEPCSTFGKTPPCTMTIIDAGFARVVYGATDPNPEHRGKALDLLTKAGIEVTTGVLEEECIALNSAWNHRMKTGMPWITAKCGMSLDGSLIVQNGPRWITSVRSRRDAMYLRAKVDAILVGGATVRTDNPALTIRGIKIKENHPQPWRIVWTKSAKIPEESLLLSDEHRNRTIIMHDIPLSEALKNLALRGISSVMIEGGGKTLSEAFANNLVNEIRFYVAPHLLGGPSWMENLNLKPKPTSPQNKPTLPQHEGMIDKISRLIAPLNLSNISYRAIGKDVAVSALVEKSSVQFSC